MRLTATASLFLLATVASSCADPVRRYPLQAPLWNDADRNHVAARPAPRFSGLVADGADQMVLRPLSKVFALPLADEAMNVNSLDEVPNSAWFTNRIGIAPMTADQIRRGACSDGPALDPAQGTWTVTAAKPDGANPGFFITASDGTRYLLKFDGHEQPMRATSADVVGSKLYHAFGYHVPCNEIVYFSPERLVISPRATRKNEFGESVPITPADVDKVLAAAIRTKDGLLRASASRFLPGKPLGPFRYEGTRADDPNDVVPHERRRELRAARLFAAWINHFDSREQNTLDVWVEEGGRSYIRHYTIDWGDSFGSVWPSSRITRRLGHSGYMDLDHVFGDLVTFGALSRPWHGVVPGPAGETFGYFDERGFVASRWRGGYANPAFDRMSDGDAAWAVRILARFGESEVRAAVASAMLPDPKREVLVRTLLARRDLLLREYLTRLSPLTRFTLVRAPGDPAQALCFEDDALRANVASAASTSYRVRMLAGPQLEDVLGEVRLRPTPDHAPRSCLGLPVGGGRPADRAGAGAPDGDPRRYGVVELVTSQTPSDAVEGNASVRLHLYDLGPSRGFSLVGVERPRIR